MKSDDIIAIIPARYGSTRFPGKPLVIIDGEPMVVRVWRAAAEAVGRAVVAVDDERIASVVRQYGGEVVMTSVDCPNGTARVAQAYRRLGCTEEIVINVQGDEPRILPVQIRSVALALMSHPLAEISTLALRWRPDMNREMLLDPNRVKLVTGADDRVLYFSRSVIPYHVHATPPDTPYYIHAGIYAYRASTLASVVDMPPSPLSIAENLEQLTWLTRGMNIVTAYTDHASPAIDTPADLERVLKNR